MTPSCPPSRHVVVVARTHGIASSVPLLAHILLALPNARLQVLVVDDDPGDGADGVVSEFGGQVRVLDRPSAGGVAGRYGVGLVEALALDPDVVVQMAADGSHLPADIELLVTSLVTSGAPVVGSSPDFRAWDAHLLRSVRPAQLRGLAR